MRLFSIGPIEMLLILVVGGVMCFPTISLIFVVLAKLLGIRMRGDRKKDRE